MSEKPNLSDFDQIGQAVDKIADPAINTPAGTKAAPVTGPKPPAKPRIQPRKFALGCLTFFFGLFAILIVAMIFGLNAGEETILNFGLSPASFKNWTIGMVSMLFGSLGLIAIIYSIFQFGRRLLAGREERAEKARAGLRALTSFGIAVLIITIWYFVYSYISRFEMKPPELPIEIVTQPEYTYELTSPIQIEFSAERIVDAFKKNYDLVSYEWDKDGDGEVDDTGSQVTLYFPHGGKFNGVYNVTLRVRMQPKSGGDSMVKEYVRTVSISKQEIYGEIESDPESGEVPLKVKLDAANVADPQGSEITNYSWDLDADGRADRDSMNYRQTEWTFKTIGEHKVTLTVTSGDFLPDGRHEEKTFEKIITVYEPSELVEGTLWIKADPKKGFAPLTVNLEAARASSGGLSQIDKYEWRIGDGLDKLHGQRNKFTFEKPGTYPVELVATYYNGQIQKDMVEIQVNDASFAPEAIITTEPPFSTRYQAVAGSAPLTIKFSADESKDADDNIVQYDWDLDGDGIYDTEGSTVEHKYWMLGEYHAKLRTTDSDGNEDETEVKVTVGEEMPVVDFGADKLSGAAPLTVNFDASGSRLPAGRQITSYEWDFGTGQNQNQQTFINQSAQTSHVFETVGSQLVTLTLHADDGTEYYDILKIVATNPTLNSKFSASRVSGTAPLAVSFDASASSGNITRHEWVFNDGGTSSEKSPAHVFAEAGEYNVVLSIYDAYGNVSKYSQTIVAK